MSDDMKKCYILFQKLKSHPQFYTLYSSLTAALNDSDNEHHKHALKNFTRIEASLRDSILLKLTLLIPLGSYSTGAFWNDIKNFFALGYEVYQKDE